MWKESLEAIKRENTQYGGELNDGASEKEIKRFIAEVKNRLNFTLPAEYIDVLRTVNGIEYNGAIMYGIDEELLENSPKQGINGLIDCNEVWYDNEWQKRYLFLGESEMSLYAFDLDSKKYFELDNPSGDECCEYGSFAEMLDKMLKDALSM